MLRGLASLDVLTIRLREVTFDGVVLEVDVGALTHERVMKSIRLTGQLIPEFKTPAPP